MKIKRFFAVLLLMLVFVSAFSTTSVLALTEEEVQAEVEKNGKEAVSGNVFIWFLCAVAFLKVSQKIDSFMQSLGLNVGQTGSSMVPELMLAAKTVASAGGQGIGRFRASGSVSGQGSSTFAGGLAGIVSRNFQASATNVATGQGGGIISKQLFNSSLKKGGEFATNIIGSVAKGNGQHVGYITGEKAGDALTSYLGLKQENGAGAAMQTNVSANNMTNEAGNQTSFVSHMLGQQNANIANTMQASSNVSPVIQPESNSEYQSGMQVPTPGESIPLHTNTDTGLDQTPAYNSDSIPTFTDVSIGSGKISGTETSVEYPNGKDFCMYSAEQYAKPTDGHYDIVTTVDNSKWYRQYAEPAVERTPYMTDNGQIAYREEIVDKLPKPPLRKER